MNWREWYWPKPEEIVARTVQPLTKQQIEHFDRAFRKMDEAFIELNKVFKP